MKSTSYEAPRYIVFSSSRLFPQRSNTWYRSDKTRDVSGYADTYIHT